MNLCVLHLSDRERETGMGVDRDELIAWYLEQREEFLTDQDQFEFEEAVIGKALTRLVKVSKRGVSVADNLRTATSSSSRRKGRTWPHRARRVQSRSLRTRSSTWCTHRWTYPISRRPSPSHRRRRRKGILWSGDTHLAGPLEAKCITILFLLWMLCVTCGEMLCP